MVYNVLVMNNPAIFIIGAIYGNEAINKKHAHDSNNYPRFISGLYNNEPDNCPWPKSKELAIKQIKENNSIFNYFIPIKRTKSYIFIKEPYIVNGKHTIYRYFVKRDKEGNEYIKINDIILKASEIIPVNEELAEERYLKERNTIIRKNQYLRKHQEIEEYGYTFVTKMPYEDCSESTTKRLNSIEELNDYFGL